MCACPSLTLPAITPPVAVPWARIADQLRPGGQHSSMTGCNARCTAAARCATAEALSTTPATASLRTHAKQLSPFAMRRGVSRRNSVVAAHVEHDPNVRSADACGCLCQLGMTRKSFTLSALRDIATAPLRQRQSGTVHLSSSHDVRTPHGGEASRGRSQSTNCSYRRSKHSPRGFEGNNPKTIGITDPM